MDTPASIPPKPRSRRRSRLAIIEERCKGCAFCIDFCMKDVLERSTRFNAKGYYLPEVKNPDACVGCAMCEMLCPDFAIYVFQEEDQPDPEQPNC